MSSQVNSNSNKIKETKNSDDYEYYIEHFVKDEDLIREYKELYAPFKNRGKYCLFYSTLILLGSYKYCQNINFFMNKFFPNRKSTFGNLLKISLIHTSIFTILFFSGNIFALGINPKEFYRKMKIIDKKMIDIDPNANLTLKEFGQLFTKETQVDLSSINDNENIKDNK